MTAMVDEFLEVLDQLACPAWCTRPADHGYEGNPNDGGDIYRHHYGEIHTFAYRQPEHADPVKYPNAGSDLTVQVEQFCWADGVTGEVKAYGPGVQIGNEDPIPLADVHRLVELLQAAVATVEVTS